MHIDQIQQLWNLWNLKTLFPNYGPEDLATILAEGQSFDQRQANLFAQPQRALALLGKPATKFLNMNPELGKGLVISLHLGPYSLAPVPWLLSGRDVHVLVNRMSLAEIKPIYDGIQNHLSLPGKIIWVPIEGQHFALKIVRALRRGKTVFAFLDGNDGLGGSPETLREGMTYELPGRTIKVRTGLARLAARCNAPIHSIYTRWPDTGDFTWERGPTWEPDQHLKPENTTKAMFDWAFGVVTKNPPQWKCWNMLTGVYTSFTNEANHAPLVAIPENSIVKWTQRGKLWPGDMLEDLAGHCFYSAEGLTANDITRLKCPGGAPVGDLKTALGEDWVARHLSRLKTLGFVSWGE
jgi:hypothetical protein